MRARIIIATLASAVVSAAMLSPLPATAVPHPGPVELVSATNELPNPSPGDNNSGDPSISDDGRYIVFTSRATNFDSRGSGNQIYLRDTVTGTTTLISTDGTRGGLLDQGRPVISGDGNFVAYISESRNLAAGTNGLLQALRWSRASGSTQVVSLSNTTPAVAADPGVVSELAISRDGQRIAFGQLGAVDP